MAENRPIDRLLEYLKHNNITPSKAEKTLGVSNAYIQNSNNRKGEIGSSILAKLSNEYLDLNLIWLITGKGEMLLYSEDRHTDLANTPVPNQDTGSASVSKKANYAPPTSGKTAPPNAPPTDTPTTNLGLPKVITVNDNNEDLIPFVGTKVAAGYLNGYADPEYIESLPTIRMPGFRDGTYRAFENKGHSMLPTLHTSSVSVGRWVERFEDIRDRRIYIVVSKSEGIVVKRVLNRISDSGKLILLSDNLNKIDYPNIVLDASEVKEVWYLRGAFIFDFPEPGEMYSRVNDLEARLTLMEHNFQKLLR